MDWLALFLIEADEELEDKIRQQNKASLDLMRNVG